MNIQLGQYAGFCFGVNRAVSMVEEAAKAGGTVVTLGPIIHNHHVVDRFQRMGGGRWQTARRRSGRGVRWCSVPTAYPGRWRRPWLDCRSRWWMPPAPLSSGFTAWFRRQRRRDGPRDHRHPHPPGGGGHCQLVLEGMVFEGPEELERWAALPETSPGLPICLVSQTTLTANLWNLCVKIVKNSLLTSEFLIQYAKQQNIGKKKRHTCQKSVKLWLLWVMPRVPTRAVLR